MSKVTMLSCMDTSILLDLAAFCASCVFSGAVEPGKIETAWHRLGKAWPALGAYVRRNEKTGKTEIVTPEATNLELKTTSLIVNRTLAETEPQFIRTKSISTQVTTRSPYLYRTRDIQDLHRLVASGDPIWSLHVTYLKDATILALTFPHLMDGKGYQTLMKGLMLAMDGQPIPPLLPGDPWSVVLPEAQDSLTSKTGVVWDAESMQAMERAMIADLEATGPIQTRTIYFPASEIVQLKQQAIDDIRRVGYNDVKWFSTSDVLGAWFYQRSCIGLADGKANTRFIHPINSQKYFPEAFPPGYSYLFNTVFVASADPLSAGQICSMSFGEIARFIRLSVIAHSARGPLLSLLKSNYEHQGLVYMPLAPGENLRGMTSWLSFDFGDLALVNHIHPGSGSGRMIELTGEGIGIPSGIPLIKFKDAHGGIVCEMNWGIKHWTSGIMAKYALEMQTGASTNLNHQILKARL